MFPLRLVEARLVTRAFRDKIQAYDPAVVRRLLEIDHEIGIPYTKSPQLYASEAWSRRAEYPWVVHALRRARSTSGRGYSVLDLGSGNSPLPALLAEEGHNVTCLDLVFHDAYRAYITGKGIAAIVGNLWGVARDGPRFEVVTCISVLEHIRNVPLSQLIFSVTAWLGDRGMALVSVDVKLTDYAPVGFSLQEVKAALYECAGEHIHLSMSDVLTSTDAPEAAWVGPGIGCLVFCLEKHKETMYIFPGSLMLCPL